MVAARRPGGAVAQPRRRDRAGLQHQHRRHADGQHPRPRVHRADHEPARRRLPYPGDQFPDDLLSGLPRSRAAHAHRHRHAEPSAEDALERRVTDAFPNVTAVRVRETLGRVAALIGNVGMAVRLTAIVTLVAGTLVLAGAIAAGHRRGTYEAGGLKVLRQTRRELLPPFLLEYGPSGPGRRTSAAEGNRGSG